MLKQIEVGEGWHRYKSDVAVVPGNYFVFPGRPAKEIKAALDLVAVSDPGGRFRWLAPAELWVKRVIDGWLDASNWVAPVNPDTWPIDPNVLRPWQREFIRDGYTALSGAGSYRRAAVVSLGGGKTLTGLCLSSYGEVVVVLAPRYLHETWESEAKKWGFTVPYVTTYESAHKAPKPDILIVDEILALKNPDSQRHQKVLELADGVPCVVGLTATPIGGKGPMDWRWLRVIHPGCVPSAERSWRFLWGLDTQLKEVAPERNAYVTTQWAVDKISRFVSPYVLSVDTSEIISDLPEIDYQRLNLPQPKDYPFILKGGASVRSKSKVIAQCRQCSDGHITQDNGGVIELNRIKLDAALQFVENLGEPVVVYAAWDHTITRLERLFQSYEPSVIRGSTTDVSWQIKRFKSGLTKVLIANSRFSQGMNLQEVCRVLLFLSWSLNPTDRTQAIGRIYRPGQKRGCVVVDLVCKDTLDSRCLELISNHLELGEKQIETLLGREL